MSPCEDRAAGLPSHPPTRQRESLVAVLLGIAPTERHVTLRGINIYRIAGDKLAQSHVSWDILGLLQQLGAAEGTPAFPGEYRARAD